MGLDAGLYSVTVTASTGCDTILRNILIRNDSLNCGGTRDSLCRIYTGGGVIRAADCDSLAMICTDITPANANQWTVTDNGVQLFNTAIVPCAADTTIWYTYFTLTRFYPTGPYTLRDWTVNGRVYTTTFANIPTLVDSMNRWDATGNWRLNSATQTIIGGDTRKSYGDINVDRRGRTVATFRVNRQIVPTAMGVKLDTGRHQVIFRNAVRGCSDTAIITVTCPDVSRLMVNREIDTVIYVGDNYQICLPTYGMNTTRSTMTNICESRHTGNAGYEFNDPSDCISLYGFSAGRDTVCVRRCWNNVCDTTIIRITVRQMAPSDTACIAPYTGTTTIQSCDRNGTTICTNLTPLDTANFVIRANGAPYTGGWVVCGNDTVRSYTYFSLVFNYANGPYQLNAWTVNGRTYSGTLRSIPALVDSMNRWDPRGNWTLEPRAYSIKGGVSSNTYGNMEFSRNGNVIARFEPNRRIVANRVAMRLDTGRTTLVFQNRVRNCPPDTLRIKVVCDSTRPTAVRNATIDTAVRVGGNLRICLPRTNGDPRSTALSNVCLSRYVGNALYEFDDLNDCITINGNRRGGEVICLQRCNSVTGICDTTTIFISVTEARMDTCPRLYSGGDTLRTSNCAAGALMCLNIAARDSAYYVVTADGNIVSRYESCGSDTAYSYTYFTLTRFNTPPYTLDSWNVNGRTRTATGIRTMQQLVDSMNVWDFGGGWSLDTALYSIRGGVASRQYGIMKFSKNGRSIAEMSPNTRILPRDIAVRLSEGSHRVLMFNTLTGCRDSANIVVRCGTGGSGNVGGVRYFYDVTVGQGNNDTICLSSIGSARNPNETTIRDICAPHTQISASIQDSTDCIIISGNLIGRDSLCLVRCDARNNCDTFIVRINVIRKLIPARMDTVVRWITVGRDSVYCLDTMSLRRGPFTITNLCDPNASNAVNFVWSRGSNCVTYMGDVMGSDTACLRICDTSGNCDTTILIVHVGNRPQPPIANDDHATTVFGTPIRFNILRNDSTWGLPVAVRIISQPRYGSVRLDSNDKAYVIYETGAECLPLDTFRYVIENGWGIDTATVVVEVLCEDVIVYSGFSPNDDGSNDTFTVLGIEKYPNSKLCVFNRWGNMVFEKAAYQNDWGGTYENKPLPDGTYFWILDLGTGQQPKSGYLQIHR
jgi:gliding motility-associated-like protein